MARLRIETAPEVTIYDEAFVLKAANGATAPLIQFKDSSGSVVGNITTAGVLNVSSVVASSAGSSSTDLATRGYVDTIAAGTSWHTAAALTTAAALPTCTYNNGSSGVGATLTASANGALTVDGVAVESGYSILVKDQASGLQNGIYSVTTVGSGAAPWVLTRRTDADNSPSGEVKSGDAFYTVLGTTNAGQSFVITSSGTGSGGQVDLGTDSIVYSIFAGTNSAQAGAGLTREGLSLHVGTASNTRILVNADNIDLANIGSPTPSSGSNTVVFIDSVTVDVYGRTTGYRTASVDFTGYALLASPALSGTPTAPTANTGTNNTQIATTSFVETRASAAESNAASAAANVHILKSVFDNKGDLLVGSANDTSTRLGVGADGLFLKTNSSAAVGIEWASIPTINNLDDVGDVTITSATNGQFLKWNGSAWINDSIPTINTLDDVGDVTITSAASGQFLKWNGSAWINDVIDLGTDTAGNYVSNVSAGTGISVTHTPGEGSTATIAVSNVVVQTTDTGTVTSTMIADNTIVNGDISTSAAIAISKLATGTAGQVIVANATGVPTYVTPSGDVSWDSTGNVQIAAGTIVNADVSASAAIALSKLASGTSAQVVVANSTGVPTYVSLSGDVTITNAGVTALAPNITISNNLVVSGNLTVSGTTTTVNTATLSVADNIITLNSDVTSGSPTENAGVEVLRGSSATVAVRWNETNDKWESTNDGTTYGNIVTTADSGTVTSTMIADGTIVNADINASAAIALSKLAAGTSGQVPVANATGVLTYVTPSGDVTLTNAGNVQIAAGAIVNADINASAAIELSKLAAGTSGQVLVANATGVLTYVTPSGDVTLTNAGNVQIAAGAIVNADISDTAAIDQGKIADTILNQQVASYTLVLGDKNKMIEISNASATTLTVPADNTVNMATGATLTVLQTGAGQVTIAAAAGVTVNGTPGLKLRTQWSSATLIKRAANTWVAVGDLAA